MAEDQGTGCPIFIERCITGEMRRSKKALPLQYTRWSKQASCDYIFVSLDRVYQMCQLFRSCAGSFYKLNYGTIKLMVK